jgi:phosphoserine aminotransferase
MAERKHNFNAGPGALPRSVLEEVQQDLVDWKGTGMSVMEMSHRTPVYEGILFEARDVIASLYDMPDTHEVLFLQGGASLQFAMVPSTSAGGAPTSTPAPGPARPWRRRARVGFARRGVERARRSGFKSVPGADEALDVPGAATYLHYTTNNTIYGTQYHHLPRTDAPLVATCRATSSRGRSMSRAMT